MHTALMMKINDKGYSFQFTTKTTPEIKKEDEVDEVDEVDKLKQATLRARLDIKNPSILHTAVIENNEDNVTEFANKESVMLTDANIRTPLFYAVHMGNIDLAEILIKANPESVNICDKDGNSPLHRAVEANDIAMAKLLIANNANVNAQNLIRQSPLHITINKDDLEKGNLNMVKLLNTNEKITTWDLADTDGNTPLHCACRPNYKNPDMVEYLIAQDVNVNAQNLKGETPLYCAIHTPGNEEVVEILLKRNADVLIKSNAGVSPVDQIKSWIAEVEKIVDEKIQDPTLAMLVAKEREQQNITSENAIDIKPKEMNQTTVFKQGIDRKERTDISALLTQQIVTTPEKKNNYLGIAYNQLKSPNATNKPTYKLPTNGRPPSGKMPDRKNLTDFER
jgi:ankyrin repeat protein